MISNERLAEIAGIEPADGDPVRVERRKMAAELLAARETIERLTDDLSLPGYNRLVAERDAARAEVEQARRDGQEIAAGLHELVAELRARLADVERQRDELVKTAAALVDQIDRSTWVEQETGFGHELRNNQRLHKLRLAIAEQPPAEKAEGGS